MAMIEIQALTKRYGTKTVPKTAIDGFSLTVEPEKSLACWGLTGRAKAR
jgi:ABC-type multidrug transport system ATPase subunit